MKDPQKEISQVQKKICSWAISFALLAALVFLLFDEKAIAKGLILGTFFSIINFILMGKSIPMVIGKSRPRARMIGMASILMRYVLLAIPMIVGVKSASFSFVAVVVGIFSVQIVTLLNYILIKPVLEGK
ncbi:MAG: ATP synthase subunit I [Desulfatiglans sp.]|jgi:hypothetical protein|nr:ATP synthase subunit I [Thermodesulfobacteriota bacterium]MEE4354045.1 ATP synthase subunit I [Desulfatiglans sp.]